MTQPRRFARVRPTGLMAKTARILTDPKATLIDCTVIDYSAGGACLEVGGQVTLPKRFELLYGPTRKKCRVVWTSGRRIGVAF
ncbi:MAG: pilus assembly protein PilZ [Rhizobiales bacterium 62-47]|nr:PilZ domain-containing protein [Hyphomicrobiales bacterium]OJY09263.1 MAG: pilus assembly protein PilZ [Rhizobiales bacterium 62-47]